MGTRFKVTDGNLSVCKWTLLLIPILSLGACAKKDSSKRPFDVYGPAAAAQAACEEANMPEDMCSKDCFGEWAGKAAVDECGKCVLGNTGLVSCRCGNGVVNAGEICDDGEHNGSTAGYCKIDCSAMELPPGMVWVPAGDFIYGSGETRTTEAFFLDIHEVTAEQYKACVGAGDCEYNGATADSDDLDRGRYRTYSNQKNDHPVNYVGWEEAKAYCTWRDKRLPTEIEWEKAARGTDGRTYPWGDLAATCAHVVMKEGETSADNGCKNDSTWEVGQKPDGASPYGAYDMAGNLWEWTDSWYSSDEAYRVLRGGSFNNFGLASATRSRDRPAIRGSSIGFRCFQ